MKKILYTINYLANNGPTKVLLSQIDELHKDKNYKIAVLTIIDANDKDIEDHLLSLGINIIKFKIEKSIRSLLKNRKQIIKKIIELDPDIIHTHGIVTSLLVASNKIDSKKITTVHNNPYEDYAFTYGKLKGFLIAEYHLFRLKKFTYIICCSKTSYEAIKNNFNHIAYIRNGIDVNLPSISDKEIIRKRIRNELNIPSDAVVYCYAGVLTRLKRVKELVNLFNNNLKDNEYLIIIGDGEEYIEIQSVIKNDNIKMLGFKKDIFDYYFASDIYVSNSSSEGFSISIIEALSANLLLLLSDIPAHRECFEIDKNEYIGEFFNDNFIEKKEAVFNKLDKVSTINFYKRYLSASAMMKEYKKYYEKILIADNRTE